MRFHLFWPDQELLKRNGFGSVAHVPVIFDGEWRYQTIPSRYLRERALLEFPDTARASGRALRFPTEASLCSFGESLTNFLEWCVTRGLDWCELEYTKHLIGGYQREMLQGRWSAKGDGLSASTVNGRVGEAGRFLTWGATRGVRKPFQVLTNTGKKQAGSFRSTSTQKSIEVVQRAGTVRRDPRTLRMPTDTEVTAWHRSVAAERGETKALICELVIKSGIRREEAVQWRVDTLPINRDEWNVVGDHITVPLRYGTKGTKTEDENDEKVGPLRYILLPLDLADRIDSYRRVKRPQLQAKYVRSAPSTAEKRMRMRSPEPRLFLSDFDGTPISAKVLYEAWTVPSKLPFEGWCPHLGRHYWACKRLLDSLEKR